MLFSGGSDPRSARARAVETQFAIFGVPSRGVSFLLQFVVHLLYIWRRNFLKRHFKIELKQKKLQKCFICAFWLFWALFWPPYGVSFLASGAWVPSKRQGFLEPGALEPPKVVSHPVWGHWRFRHIMFSRVGRLGPRRKRPSNMLAPGSGRQAIQKKAHRIDNHLGSATSQTQERKKEANKRITTIGSPHRGGLGAAHSDK